MSEIFLEELGVGEPDYSLGVGSGSHAQQTARVMERLEPVLLEAEPDVVLVPGDVNSTVAAALTASKLLIPIGHVEAGLRSFDRTMPEEINRIVADQLSQLLFIHSPEARDNLLAEGVLRATGIHDVGNTMIDSLVAMRARIEAAEAPEAHGLDARRATSSSRCTGPRSSTARCSRRRSARLADVSEELPIVFPVHPRTRAAHGGAGHRCSTSKRLRLLDPLGYFEFLSLVAGSAGVLTDSGGIQEETTYLGLPCFTLRANTERPITVSMGTNDAARPRPGSGSARCPRCWPRRGRRRRRSRRSGTARRPSES